MIFFYLYYYLPVLLLLKYCTVICFIKYSRVKLCEILVLDMRRDIQEIFRVTPHEKQVMMFSATLSKEVRPICKKFMQDVIIHPPRRIAVGAKCRSGGQRMLV